MTVGTEMRPIFGKEPYDISVAANTRLPNTLIPPYEKSGIVYLCLKRIATNKNSFDFIIIY